MRSALVIALALLWALPAAQADEKDKPRTVEVYMQQKERKDGSTKFYMWIKDEDAEVVNTAPNISVGYSFGKGGGIYLDSNKLDNAMFFVHPYDKKKSGTVTRIEFGGSRPNDIHIYLPENTKGVVKVSSIHYQPPKPETEDD